MSERLPNGGTTDSEDFGQLGFHGETLPREELAADDVGPELIGDLPMLWKELHIESRIKLNWLGWGIIIVLVLLTIGSGVFAITLSFAPR